MLNVAFPELTARRQQDVLARNLGPGIHQAKHILQLIAEAVRAARLVERRARPKAAA